MRIIFALITDASHRGNKLEPLYCSNKELGDADAPLQLPTNRLVPLLLTTTVPCSRFPTLVVLINVCESLCESQTPEDNRSIGSGSVVDVVVLVRGSRLPGDGVGTYEAYMCKARGVVYVER